MTQALLSEHLLPVQFPMPGTIVKVLGPLWPMDAWKRASPIQTVIVSQVHCLISHFSGKTDLGMFLVGLVCRIGFVCSSCWENLGSGMRGGERRSKKRVQAERRWRAWSGAAGEASWCPVPQGPRPSSIPGPSCPREQAASLDATC